MAQDRVNDYVDERAAQAADQEQEVEQDKAPMVPPPAAKAMLSGPMASAQRQALVQSVGQNFGNKQVQRMLGSVRRSAASGLEGGALEQDLSQKIQSERSNGQPMDSSVRRQAEQSLGYDLSKVRVHTGETASDLNSQLGAKAFTTGRDIFYGAGQSPSDMGLTLHEATHTVQQGMSEDPPGSVGAADTAHEHEAHSNASNSGAAVGGGVQREAEDDEVAMMRDSSVQREGEDDEVAMLRDPSVQREAEDDEVAMMRDPSVQREADDDEVAMLRDPSVQREAEDDEVAMMRDPSVQREEADEQEAEG